MLNSIQTTATNAKGVLVTGSGNPFTLPSGYSAYIGFIHWRAYFNRSGDNYGPFGQTHVFSSGVKDSISSATKQVYGLYEGDVSLTISFSNLTVTANFEGNSYSISNSSFKYSALMIK